MAVQPAVRAAAAARTRHRRRSLCPSRPGGGDRSACRARAEKECPSAVEHDADRDRIPGPAQCPPGTPLRVRLQACRWLHGWRCCCGRWCAGAMPRPAWPGRRRALAGRLGAAAVPEIAADLYRAPARTRSAGRAARWCCSSIPSPITTTPEIAEAAHRVLRAAGYAVRGAAAGGDRCRAGAPLVLRPELPVGHGRGSVRSSG